MRRKLTIVHLALVWAAVATGCQSAPVGRGADTLAAAGGRSLAMDGGPLRRAEQRAGLADDAALAWYDGRNDVQPSTYAGYISPTYEFSSTLTYDRQSSSNGDVRDYYHQRTTRGRVQRSIR